MRVLILTIVLGVLLACGGRTESEQTLGVHDPASAFDQSMPPEIPFEDPGVCPFEGCVYGEWTAKEHLVARQDHRDDAPAVFEIAQGERVTAMTGTVITLRAGVAEAEVDLDLETSEGPITMKSGERAYLLTPLGEGHTRGWIRGRMYKDVLPSRLVLNVRPLSVWWAQVRNASGQTGWVHAEPFTGKDSRE